MRPIFLIAWREYKQYVFSRGFLLFMVMFPLGVILGGVAVGILENSKPARSFVVYDETGQYVDMIDRELDQRWKRQVVSAWDDYAAAALLIENRDPETLAAPFTPGPVTKERVAAFEEAGWIEAANNKLAELVQSPMPSFEPPRRQFLRLPLPEEIETSGSLEAASEALRPYLLGEEELRVGESAHSALFAAVLIPQGFGGQRDAESVQYWSRNLTDSSLRGAVSRALDASLQRQAAAEIGVGAGVLDQISEIDAPVSSFRPDRLQGEAELGAQDKIETWLPAGLTYMLLVIIFGVGNLLLTNTIEERSNKIVEVLLSSVTAGQLMIGKLVGIAAVGLTMPTVFIIGGLITSVGASGNSAFMQDAMAALFSSNLLLIYLFYFVCAYLIFAMIFLAIGAVSNSLQDAQSYMGPVMLLVFAPLPFMIMVYQNPNGLVASILTWIPIYTPYAVMMRAASDPPLWEILGATALMLAFATVLVLVMGRIFRRAILQAAPPKMRDVWRLTRSTGE